MTKAEMENELRELQQDFDTAKRAIYRRYALANNPYKVGDIITDHHTTIKIETIGTYVGLGEPECKYIGTQLNKDGSISKKQNNNTIYQTNIVTD